MPRIDELVLDSVVYLYPTEQAAKRGEASGGTGFLVAVPSIEVPECSYYYAVTNRHVIHEQHGNSPVIRFNTHEGGIATLALHGDDWVMHPDLDDIAIHGPLRLDQRSVKCSAVPVSLFLTKEIIAEQEIGPGDETFMVGRFVAHEGKKQNRPTVRFGCISRMPDEPIKRRDAIQQESFLVETRSLGGYSGSPVFVFSPSIGIRPTGANRRTNASPSEGEIPLVNALEGWYGGGPTGPWLLGVDWGHLPIYEPVCEKDRKTRVQEEYVVPSNSGQMGVVPAWRLLELLNLAEVETVRRKAEEGLARTKAESSIILDAAEMENRPGTEPERLKIEGDWQDAARKLARTPKPKGGWPKEKRSRKKK